MKFVDIVREAKAYEHHLILWPRRWLLCDRTLSLTWQTFPFRKAAVNKMPDSPGVYAFLIQPRIGSDLEASYPMYIGMTDRSLRDRFAEYLREVQRPLARPKVLVLVKSYRRFMYFSCCIVTRPVRPATVEEELLQAFIPPANDRYPASVHRVVAAFR